MTNHEKVPEPILNPSSADYAATYKKATITAIAGEVIVMFFIIVLINIAYGCGFDPVHSMRNRVDIAIWTEVGSNTNLIESAVLKITNDPLTFGLDYHFKFIDSSHTPYEDLGDKIQKGEYWGVFAVTSGASAALTSSINTGASRSSSAVQYWYDQARGGASYGNSFGAIGQQISSIANGIIRSTVLSQPSKYTITAASATALSSPVTLSSNNIHPVLVNGAFTATGTAFLQLFLIGLIHVFMIVPMHAELRGRGIIDWQLDNFQGFHRLISSFIISFWMAVILFSVGWKDPIEGTKATNFFSYWAFLWMSLTVFQNMSHHLLDLLGFPMGAMSCILLVITMNFTSGATNPFDTIPLFYSIGYLLPFYHMVVGTRSILFNSFSKYFPVAVGVMMCWAFALHWGLTMKKLWFGSSRALHLYDDTHSVEAEKREKERRDSIAAAAPEEGEAAAAVIPNSYKLWAPEVRPYVKSVIRKSLFVELLCCVFFVLYVLITFGGGWDPARYLYRLRICVLNLDLQNHPSNPSPLDVALSIAATSVIPSTGFTVDTAVASDFTFDNVYREVQEGRYWGALVLNDGAYASLTQWLSSPSTVTKASMPYVTFISNDKRGGGFVNGRLSSAANAAFGAMTTFVTKFLIASGTVGKNVYALSSPVSTYNLLQYPNPNDRTNGVDGSINSMAIVLYLTSIPLGGILDATHAGFAPLGFSYKIRQTMKVLHACLAAFFVSFWPAISLLWYGYQMSGSQFFQYWAWMWLGMSVYLAAGMAVSHIFGHAGMPIGILLFTLNTASGGSTTPIELQPFFYRIGYGLPFYNIVAGARYILFGSRVQDFNRAIWVLFIWIFYITFVASRLEFRKKVVAFFLGKHEASLEEAVGAVDEMSEIHQITAAAVTAAINASGTPDKAQEAEEAAVQAASQAAATDPVNKSEITVAAVAAAIHVCNNPDTHDKAMAAAARAAHDAHLTYVAYHKGVDPASLQAVTPVQSPTPVYVNPNPPSGDEVAEANKLYDADTKKTVLMEAARVGNATEVYVLLSKGANVNVVDSDGATALFYAAANNNVACVQALIAAKADVEAKRDNGQTALLRAALWGSKESVAALLKAGADVNAVGSNGSNAYVLTKDDQIRSILKEFGFRGHMI